MAAGNKGKSPTENPQAGWLILMYRLPAKPAYQRVKLWRQLHAIGAVGLRNSAYVLPTRPENRDAFERILREIDRCDGDGLVCQSELIAGMRDDQLRALFNTARDREYEELTRDMRKLLQTIKRRKKITPDTAPAMVRLRQRLADIERLDFFAASGRRPAEALLAQLDHSPIVREEAAKTAAIPLRELTGKSWVTRQDIHVDRIACAWLIKRFVDPKGSLKFVSGKSYAPGPGEYRYDMQDGEFTHEGENCSFETLLVRARIADPALKAIGEIIHDIDLNDGKFGHAETPGIAHVIAGICRTQGSDEARVARGQKLFDDIYEQFRRRKP
jgi:hypothetical protein